MSQDEIFGYLRNTGSQINGATSEDERKKLQNNVIDVLEKMVEDGYLNENNAASWLDLFGI